MLVNFYNGGLGPPSRLASFFLRLARPAAAAGVAERNVAAAAALAAGFEAIAAGLQHIAALGVAAGARDAAAVLRVFNLAMAAAQVEIANLDAVPRAAARAGAVAQSLTKTLQGLTSGCVFARAREAETALALLELQLATRHDAHVLRRSRGGRGAGKGWRRSRRKSTSTFQYSAGHKQHSFS